VADWLRSPVLAFALRRLDMSSLSEISRLLPELTAERPEMPRPSARIEDWQRLPFFQALARAFLIADRPLLLILDDLQWCDADTLEWLHFLLRFDRRANLLVAGTVRPEEVDRHHPLTGVLAELRDAAQLTEVGLGALDASETSALATQIAGRQLGAAHARQIHLETEGNPLFVVEMVRVGLGDADRGGATDSAAVGPGEPGSASVPRRLPPRIQAVIAARLAQLSEPARSLAAIAATVGRAFTLDVVREGSGVEEALVVQGLGELLRRQIVREQGDGVYDFAHDKIREVAYREMTEARRRLLHRRVAEGLERVHGAALDVVAAQIAAHYAGADMADRAAGYYQRAAEVAQRVGANQEAIDLLQRGLTLLETLPPSLDRDGRELDLRTALGVSLVATKGYGASEVSSVYTRCRQLCQILGRPPSPPILRALALASLAKAKIEECHALGDHLMSLADRDDDPMLRVEAHYVIAMALLLNGAAVPARAELEASLAHYDLGRSASHIGLYSQDPAVVCQIRLSLDLWMLGEPDEAARRRAQSLALAKELGHPFSLAYALTWDAVLQSHRGDRELARTQAEAAIDLGREHRMPFWLGFGMILHGWAVAEQGDIEGGIDEIQSGMAEFAATGTRSFVPFQLGLLAEQHGRLGNVERGLALIAEALALVERTNERWPEVELFRRKGELLEKAALTNEAETVYLRAVEVARYQGARALELRSATRLADIWLRQERPRDVALLLRPIVRRVGATTDLPDLDVARGYLARTGSVRDRRADITVR
jgi:predicted ATPase